MSGAGLCVPTTQNVAGQGQGCLNPTSVPLNCPGPFQLLLAGEAWNPGETPLPARSSYPEGSWALRRSRGPSPEA